MIFTISGLLLTAFAAFSVWCAADRLWHALVILVTAVLLFPLAARLPVTGDVSRYLPAGTFSEGLEGKDQVVVASAAASLLLAIILAACVWGAGKAVRRTTRGRRN
jgi:hypothetical protein